MATFQRILVATDLSPASEAAVEQAVQIAEDTGAALDVLYVREVPTAMAYAAAPESVYWAYVEDARRRLQQCVPGADGGTVRFLVREGAADETILDTARDEMADLIVMGTHGRRGVGRLLLGSVAARVAAQAACPVLTVRAAKPSAGRQAPAA
ncbi:MAG TPA: universal stress protein [Thermoanaerobaculia bacterium]|nr:universal stress protein [Thermoanaerobaculia bacterium]